MTKKTLAAGPIVPADWELADASAIQAMQTGEASPDQQKRALKWLIEHAAATYQFHFYPTERETAFSLGRAFVGQQIVKMLRIDLASLRRRENEVSRTAKP